MCIGWVLVYSIGVVTVHDAQPTLSVRRKNDDPIIITALVVFHLHSERVVVDQ